MCWYMRQMSLFVASGCIANEAQHIKHEVSRLHESPVDISSKLDSLAWCNFWLGTLKDSLVAQLLYNTCCKWFFYALVVLLSCEIYFSRNFSKLWIVSKKLFSSPDIFYSYQNNVSSLLNHLMSHDFDSFCEISVMDGAVIITVINSLSHDIHRHINTKFHLGMCLKTILTFCFSGITF